MVDGDIEVDVEIEVPEGMTDDEAVEQFADEVEKQILKDIGL